MLYWDDLRYFLALYRHGRLIAAGKSLQVNHTTVSRRIKELESALHVKLFERQGSGFQITLAGESLLNHAITIESTILGLEDCINDGSMDIKGPVSIGSPDDFAACFLALQLPPLLRECPGLEIDLLTKYNDRSLSSREIDIMITDERPQNSRLVTRRLTDYHLGLFASQGYLSRYKKILSKSDLINHELIKCPDSTLFEDCKKLSFRSCNYMSLYKVTQQGHGICILPYFMVGPNDGLIQVLPEDIVWKRTFWLVIQDDSRYRMRIKKVTDFISEATYREKDFFI